MHSIGGGWQSSLPDPLRSTAGGDQRCSVQELIRAGAALDLQDTDGKTALVYATEGRDGRGKDSSGGAIAAILVEAGARCPGYKRSGVFNSKCKICRESKKRHSP